MEHREESCRAPIDLGLHGRRREDSQGVLGIDVKNDPAAGHSIACILTHLDEDAPLMNGWLMGEWDDRAFVWEKLVLRFAAYFRPASSLVIADESRFQCRLRNQYPNPYHPNNQFGICCQSWCMTDIFLYSSVNFESDLVGRLPINYHHVGDQTCHSKSPALRYG